MSRIAAMIYSIYLIQSQPCFLYGLILLWYYKTKTLNPTGAILRILFCKNASSWLKRRQVYSTPDFKVAVLPRGSPLLQPSSVRPPTILFPFHTFPLQIIQPSSLFNYSDCCNRGPLSCPEKNADKNALNSSEKGNTITIIDGCKKLKEIRCAHAHVGHIMMGCRLFFHLQNDMSKKRHLF